MPNYDSSMRKVEKPGHSASHDEKDSSHSPWFWVFLLTVAFVVIVIVVISLDNGGSSDRGRRIEMGAPRKVQPNLTRYVTVSSLNIRSGPSANAEIMAKLDFGETVYLDSLHGDWSKIRRQRGGTVGWVSTQYLSKREAIDVLLDRYRSGDKIIIPCGGLSKLPRYPAGQEFYVRMENGYYETARPNDIEELLLDWFFYRNKVLKHHARGEYDKMASAQGHLQEINGWLDQYDESDISATHAYLVSIGKIDE